MGYSFCRFVCGTPDEEMGSADLHDGEWEWPEGLAHYVEHHSVLLPDEFIETMRSRSWQPPAETGLPPSSERAILKKIGYWRSRYEQTLPDPRALEHPGWYGDDLPRILAYLRGGRFRLGDLIDYAEEHNLNMLDMPEGCFPTADGSFWTIWAEQHCLPSPEDSGPVVLREWLVRPMTIEDDATWTEFWARQGLSTYAPDPRMLQVSSDARVALAAGAELWYWQYGGPARTAAGASGLAIVREGEIVAEWWLTTGALAEHASIDSCWWRGKAAWGHEIVRNAEMEDLELLQGEWEFVWEEKDGQKRDAAEKLILTIKGREWSSTSRGKNFAFCKLDPTTKPKRIDLVGGGRLGIYEIKGNMLVCCFNYGPDREQRPTRFVTEAGSDVFLYGWQRVPNSRCQK
jgi:uncharacterized protein (TIGR03067 family)